MEAQAWSLGAEGEASSENLMQAQTGSLGAMGEAEIVFVTCDFDDSAAGGAFSEWQWGGVEMVR